MGRHFSVAEVSWASWDRIELIVALFFPHSLKIVCASCSNFFIQSWCFKPLKSIRLQAISLVKKMHDRSPLPVTASRLNCPARFEYKLIIWSRSQCVGKDLLKAEVVQASRFLTMHFPPASRLLLWSAGHLDGKESITRGFCISSVFSGTQGVFVGLEP